MKKYLLLIITFTISQKSFSQLTGLTITGNPTNTNGATFVYQNTIDGVIYDLKGILFKPNTGQTTYPAIIINHGTGSNTNPNLYAHNIAQTMVTWGYVCIAVNLTHSTNVAIGSPGTADISDWGASLPNMQRSLKCWDILESLGYVDTNCISTFGHSRGAFLTTALVGTYPNKFKAAGHSAGGVDDTIVTYATTSMANGVTIPYIIHHSTNDNVVNISADNNFNNILSSNNVTHQYYNDYTSSHSGLAQDATMLQRTQTFFNLYGCTTLSSNDFEIQSDIIIYPNPTSDFIYFNNNLKISKIELFDMNGSLIISEILNFTKIDITKLPSSLYILKIEYEDKILVEKIIKK